MPIRCVAVKPRSGVRRGSESHADGRTRVSAVARREIVACTLWPRATEHRMGQCPRVVLEGLPWAANTSSQGKRRIVAIRDLQASEDRAMETGFTSRSFLCLQNIFSRPADRFCNWPRDVLLPALPANEGRDALHLNPNARALQLKSDLFHRGLLCSALSTRMEDHFRHGGLPSLFRSPQGRVLPLRGIRHVRCHKSYLRWIIVLARNVEPDLRPALE